MIQLNLLPDIKVEYMNSKRMKHKVYVFSFIAMGISIGALAVLFSLVQIQKRNIDNLTSDIKATQKEVEAIPDLAKIVTVQNQLNTLPGLYSKRPETSRLFEFIQQTTPSTVKLSAFKVDFADNSMTIQGSSSSLDQVNLYVDTLKFTKYRQQDSDQDIQAFTGTTLSEFSRTETSATFTIKQNFDLTIFDISKEVTLSVPKSVTTTSATQAPSSIFAENKEAQ